LVELNERNPRKLTENADVKGFERFSKGSVIGR